MRGVLLMNAACKGEGPTLHVPISANFVVSAMSSGGLSRR